MKEYGNPAERGSAKPSFSPADAAKAGIDHGRHERDMKDVPRGAGAELRNKAGKR